MGELAHNTTAAKSKSDYNMAIAVSDRVELEHVRLMHCNCDQTPIPSDGDLGFEIEHSVEVETKANHVLVFATFIFKAFRDNEKSCDVFASIETTFLLSYSADTLEGLEADNFREFGEINGIYNAWPYWREFVQNTIVRMGLPTLTLPVFRLSRPSSASTETKSAPESDTVQEN